MTTLPEKMTNQAISPAVEQAARLLLCLGKSRNNELTLTEICRQIDIHKSKGLSILNALLMYDLVTKDSRTKKYTLGPALMPLARKAQEKIDINAIAKVSLQKLADETRASVLLGIICNDQLYISGKYDGNDMLTVTVRDHQSLHITHGAHGKAIFAFLAEKDRNRLILSDQLYFHGKNRKVDKKRLEKELIDCRKKGYAVDNGELSPGISAVSAPIFDQNNQVIGAVVLAGTFKEDKFDAFGKKTLNAAGQISRKLGGEL